MTTLSSLRPLGVPAILDRAIRVYRRGFVPFTLIALAQAVPPALAKLLLPQAPELVLVELLTAFGLAPLVGIMLVSAAASASRGEPIVLARALADGRRSFWHAVVVAILVSITMGFPTIAVGAIVGAVLYVTHVYIEDAVVITLACILPIVVFIAVRYAVTFPSIVIEGCNTADAMSRSWGLTRRRFWRIAAVYGAAMLLSGLVLFLTLVLVSFVIGGGAALGVVPQWIADQGRLLGRLSTDVAQLLIQPLSASLSVVLYEDLRVRSDGAAIEQQIARLAEEPQALEPVAEALPMRHDDD